MNSPLRLMLVDDHAIFRSGVRSLLEGTEFSVVAEASSGEEAIELAGSLALDIILMDIRMEHGDGLAALRFIKGQWPRIAVIMLTTYDNPTYLARAIAGGASGYLLKGADYETFLDTLRKVAAGESLLDRVEIARIVRSVAPETSDSVDLIEPLTEREVEVLRVLATGLNNREIGEILYVAESTVKTHVEHIIRKLGVSDRVQAAVWAARKGLLPA